MTPTLIISCVLAGTFACGAALISRAIVRRNMHLWLGGQVRRSLRRRRSTSRPNPSAPIHVLICIADHFEPAWGGASAAQADERVEAWERGYPAALGSFRDSDGRPPRHTFFYPIDEYEPRHVDALARLCRQGYGEVEVHLHHDRDTSENLERTLKQFTTTFAHRHGLLSRWPDGRVAYGFVHGNWALDNSRPDGRWCGVNNELAVLSSTGCYADFTLPSAPDATQTSTINSIYYASGREGCCKSHDSGIEVGSGSPPPGSLMLIQGPLRLWWRRPWGRPRVENGCLQKGQAPTMERLDQWIRAGVAVSNRSDWIFVKLHSHGAKAENREVLLGRQGVEFHRALAARAADDPLFKYHYVTAREMYNLAKAAELGWSGSVIEAVDWVVGLRSGDNRSQLWSSREIGALRPAG